MSEENKSLSRRDAIKAAAVGLGGIAIAGTLTGCQSSATDRIDQANKEIIDSLDLNETHLPQGSIVELTEGRFMIIGQKAFYRLEGIDGPISVFDYYGIKWPEGTFQVYSENLATVAFNTSAIKSVLFIGYVNDEDKDYRDYMKNWNVLEQDGYVQGSGTEVVLKSGGVEKEQQARLQGKRSVELYGEHGNEYRGGYLYGDGE